MTWRQSPVIIESLSRCRFPSSDRVTCAVSGGADSLALLALAAASGRQVTAFHVDHGLRPGSHREAELVRDAAALVGAQFDARTVNVAPGPNVEARARAARYAALPDDVLTGHTADDQAETVLVNLLRGAGIDGLSGMREFGGPSGSVGHPLLALRRHDTEAVCAVLGWTPFHDPSNDDESLLRNRIRHSVLPLLHEVAGRDLAPILARQAALLADDADFLLLNAYAARVSGLSLAFLMAEAAKDRGGRIDWGELALSEDGPDARAIGLSFFARWSR